MATYALMVKFPTENGVGTIKGSQEMARRANLAVYKDRKGKEVHQVYMAKAIKQAMDESEEQAERSELNLNPGGRPNEDMTRGSFPRPETKQ